MSFLTRSMVRKAYVLQAGNIHGGSKWRPFFCFNYLLHLAPGGVGAAALMETSSSSATVVAASGLHREALWVLKRLSLRNRRSSVIILSVSARVVRVWAGRRDNPISIEGQCYRRCRGHREANEIGHEVRATAYWHADLPVVADKAEGFLQRG